MTSFGQIVKLAPGRYRVEHPHTRGQRRKGNECAHCGKPRRRNTKGVLCSTCKLHARLVRKYEEGK